MSSRTTNKRKIVASGVNSAQAPIAPALSANELAYRVSADLELVRIRNELLLAMPDQVNTIFEALEGLREGDRHLGKRAFEKVARELLASKFAAASTTFLAPLYVAPVAPAEGSGAAKKAKKGKSIKK